MSKWAWGRFTEEDYWYVRRSPLSNPQLAKKLGCWPGHIQYIRHRNLNKSSRAERFSLRYALLIAWERLRRKGRRNKPGWHIRTSGNAKLTELDVLAIRAMAASGAEQNEIVARFNITQSLVSLILNRKIWKHI